MVQRRFTLAGAASLRVLIFTSVACAASFNAQAPPRSMQRPVTESFHGIMITDPYRWLEDQGSANTRAWIAAQQKYTKSYMASLSGRDEVRAQLAKLMRVDSYQPPTVRGERQFFQRKPADKNRNQLCLREGSNGRDQVLVDANAIRGSQPASVRLLDVSQDGRLLAYGIQEGGQDELTLHLYDVSAHRDRRETFGKARFMTVSLLPNNGGFYYTKSLPEGCRVYFHWLGTDMRQDEEVFGHGYGPEKFVYGASTYDGRWLLLQVVTGWGVQSDIYVMRLGRDTKPHVLVSGLPGEFSPAYFNDQLFVMTTWKAPNRRILRINLLHPAPANWKQIIAECSDHMESATVIGGKLVINYLHDVASVLKTFSLDGKSDGDVALPSLGTIADVEGEPDHPEMFYAFSSFTYAPAEFRYNVNTHEQKIWWKAPVIDHAEDVVVQQVWYESKDKTRIPMFLVHRRDFRQDGSARALMTAYGGFDVSLTPVFEEEIAYWVDQGGLFALPNLRGGGEFGESWHRAGMFGQKQNVFDDFEYAAEYLERNHYTSASRLGIEGMSNGGLLMGAALTQRPDLFGAVVCEYPLLDMVRFDKFKVAKWWTAEYGSAENKDQFSYLYRYSPYQHVEKGGKYPAVLFVTGDGDTRVDPLHARKMTALLQASSNSGRPILLKYDTASGHSGGKPTDVKIDDATDVMLFLQHELN